MSAHPTRKGPVQFAQLATRLFDPVTAKRGFARIDLIAAWDDVVGERYAGVTQPAKMHWRGEKADGAVLTVRVAGPSAVFLQHESEQFIARINAFLGFEAVAELRIVQQPIEGGRRYRPAELPPLSPAERSDLERQLEGIENDGLKDALERLGTAVAREKLARP
jgi:hypothetical protein